ncbi:oligosaccharide flippase family protein [Butyrivibrio sp. AE3009]|uniref:oligosaccharide flippase family protein n=1 Tax=Butyrivibrio sp. AE3009 TaxID=1280666 RepID=UPI0003B4D044|nr:oligosaccharide flippase family protein [Butyrivibrio sp. AE3009]
MINTRIKTNFIFNAIYELSGIIIPLVTLPYLTRTIQAGGLGEFSFAYSVAYYFYIFIRLGLHSYGNRTIAYIKDDEIALSRVFFELYVFQAFMGIVITAIYLGYCFLFAINKELAFISAFIVLSGGIDLTWALYGLEEFRLTSVRDVLTKIGAAVCVFAFVKNSDDVWKYSLIYCSSFFFRQLISLPIVMRKVHFIKPTVSGVLSHIKSNMILFLPTIAVSIYKTMDKIMLGAMSNDKELGYYHASENVIMVPLALITALGTVMLPRISNMLSNEESSKETEDLFSKSIVFDMFISSSICFGIMTVSKEFVQVFFGKGFEKCNKIFLIILPSCIFLAFANVIRTQYLLPRKKDRLFVLSLFSGAIINLILNIILIPKYESIGAAIGTLTAEAMVCIVQAAYVYKTAKIGENLRKSVPYLISGILMYVLFRGYSPAVNNSILALFIKILISGFFYLLMLGVQLRLRKLYSNILGR